MIGQLKGVFMVLYSIIVALIFVAIILFFLVGIISPKRVLPTKLQNPNRKKVLLSTLAMFVVFFIGIDLTNKSDIDPISTSAGSSYTTKLNDEQKQEKSNDALAILGQLPQSEDKVEKTIAYKPWGDVIPPQNAIYWYAINKDKNITERIKIVNFSDGINWVFWDKIIFSTDQNRWDYDINSFAGQSGGGKSTQIVMGGKYEFFDVTFDKLAPGIKILIEGTNPTIRLQGKEAKYDYIVPESQIEHLKAGYQLYEDLKVTGGKIL